MGSGIRAWLRVLASWGLLAGTAAAVDYDADIRPVFERHCVTCHGAYEQSGGLRLDVSALLLQGGDGGPAVVPGKPEESLVFQVVAGTHGELTMPPDGPPLEEATLAVLREWISAGAPGPLEPEAPEAYRVLSRHWAFNPVQPETPPQVDDEAWVRNPIDRFVLARLEEEGLAPSPEADGITLLRRLHLDITGLPPTPSETAQFVGDPSAYAYEAAVSRLLASPHYGERWARHWLDLARYADSDGYEKDLPRPYAYRYRDWVIDAINRDMPYSQFVIEQLAGDLLPNATMEQQIATGFHRNTLTNREGGIDPEEDRVKQAYDRTDTTGQVFMGLTMNCAQCHTHKYDPITQREYFGMYAFFNDALEQDISAPTVDEVRSHEAAKARHDAKLAEVRRELDRYRPELEAGLAAWEQEMAGRVHGWERLNPDVFVSVGGADHKVLRDRAVLVEGYNPSTDSYIVVTQAEAGEIRAFRLEALRHASLEGGGPGRAEDGGFVLNALRAYVAPLDDPEDREEIVFASAAADQEQEGREASGLIDGDSETGWAVLEEGNGDREVVLYLETPLDLGAGALLTFELDHLEGDYRNLGMFRLSATASDPDEINVPDEVFAALQVPAESRRASEQRVLLAHYGAQDAKLAALERALSVLEETAPVAPETQAQTMAQNPDPPATHVHRRGDFLDLGEEVRPHTPAVLHPFNPRSDTPDRLDLARWIVDPDNPLTARVAVNRIWEKLFGEGLVRTSEDFGTRTERPTHPELLDWLASEYIARGWSTKDLIRLIVQSATYRQASHHRPELRDRDPANRLLARQNRFRVEGEVTRDLFLAVSGLLHPVVGGPSVRPPLPEGVANLGYANTIRWPESEAPDKYRRGMYIFFQRMIAYPQLLAFDCPDANVAELKRSRSNTPLQALTLLNDPVFVECAQALGERLQAEVPDNDWARIRHAFNLTLARDPDLEELQAVHRLLVEARKHYGKAPDAAAALAGPAEEDRCAVDAAAHVLLARTLMNVDEFVTRE